jgi:hypothetical protein
MNKVETSKLLAVIAAAWPRFEVTEATVTVWHQHLADIAYPAANAAVSAQITTSTFAPAIADIRRYAQYSLANPDEGEAWGQALAAVRTFGWYRKDEAMAAMHPMVAHAVERYGWDDFCRADADGVTMGLFMRLYRGMAERDRRDNLLPERLRERLEAPAADLEPIRAIAAPMDDAA